MCSEPSREAQMKDLNAFPATANKKIKLFWLELEPTTSGTIGI
jgi:hypothetical protein